MSFAKGKNALNILALTSNQLSFSVGVILPNKNSPNGPRYLLYRTGCYDVSKISLQDIFKVSGMVVECLMQEDDSFIIAGQVAILDFTDITLSHFIQFNPGFIKKSTMYQQDALPVREKGSHFVKMPSFALTVFNIFKSFLNEKNKARVSYKFKYQETVTIIILDIHSWR